MRTPHLPDDVHGRLKLDIDDAKQYILQELGPDRAKATRYYHGDKKDFDQEEGRSTYVSPDVADTINSLIPDVVEALLGPEGVIEYAPESKEDVEMAKQASDYVNKIVLGRDNDGFKLLHSSFLDAAIRKTGVLKWYWDETERKEASEMSGVDQLALSYLESQPGVEVEVLEEYEDQPQAPGQPPVLLSDVKVRRTATHGRIQVEAIPSEEFLINRDARDVQSARYVGHRTWKTVDDLVEMGYKRSEVEQYAGPQSDQIDNEEVLERTPYMANGTSSIREDEVECIESYYKVDGELRKILTIGGSYHVLENVPCARKQFVTLCPFPEPHAALGWSFYDKTKDIQDVKTHLMRIMLDSAASSIFPRTAYNRRFVDIEDIIAPEIGAPLPVDGDVNANVRELEKPFLGPQLLPVVEYMDHTREERTGTSQAAAGLDPDALQSSTRKAVEATISARQRQTQLLVRIFANDLAPMYRGILELLVENQDKARSVRLRNEWVDIRPDSWNAYMDVDINQGVGGGTIESRLAFLNGVIEHQGQLLETYGLQNPLVSLPQYSYALSKRMEMNGFKDSSRYYADIPPDWQPPEQDPTKEEDTDPLIQAQREAIQAEVQIKREEMALKQQESAAKDDRERDKDARDHWLKTRELELKYQTKLDEAEIKAEVEKERNQIQ